MINKTIVLFLIVSTLSYGLSYSQLQELYKADLEFIKKKKIEKEKEKERERKKKEKKERERIRNLIKANDDKKKLERDMKKITRKVNKQLIRQSKTKESNIRRGTFYSIGVGINRTQSLDSKEYNNDSLIALEYGVVRSELVLMYFSYKISNAGSFGIGVDYYMFDNLYAKLMYSNTSLKNKSKKEISSMTAGIGYDFGRSLSLELDYIHLNEESSEIDNSMLAIYFAFRKF